MLLIKHNLEQHSDLLAQTGRSTFTDFMAASSVASLEDSEEPFLNVSQQIATSFLDIYLSQDRRKDVSALHVAKSPYGIDEENLTADGTGPEEQPAQQQSVATQVSYGTY